MADIAISYSHRNPELAANLRREILARGLTVWMDEPDATDLNIEGIAIPWGQAHRDVIQDEFARADLVIVVDTPGWRESEYCQFEYSFLQEWGKWIAFYAPDPEDAELTPGVRHYRGFDEIEPELNQRKGLAGAHARLVQQARSQSSPTTSSRAERLLKRGEDEDARLLLSANLRDAGLALNPSLTAAAESALADARTARKKLLRLGVSSVAVLAVLAGLGSAAWVASAAGKRAAEESAAQSRSLDLASQSGVERDTVRALTLAQQAFDLAETPTSASALAAAKAANQRLRSIDITARDYVGAVLAADAPVIVAYTTNELQWINTDTGDVGAPLTLPKNIRIGAVTVSADGSHVAFVQRADRSLWVASQTERRASMIADDRVTAVATADGTDLWWATESGYLSTAPFPALDSTPRPVSTALDSLATAFTIEPRTGQLDFVEMRGTVRSGILKDGVFTEQNRFDVTPPESIADPLGQLNSAITRCGPNLFGSIMAGAQRSVHFTEIAGHASVDGGSLVYDDGELDIDATAQAIVDGSSAAAIDSGAGAVALTRSAYRIQPPVCGEDDIASYYSLIRGTANPFGDHDPVPFIPAGSLRYVPAVDTTRSRNHVISTDGQLFTVESVHSRIWDAPGATALLPMPGRDLLVMADGTIVNADTGNPTGTLSRAAAPASASVIGAVGAIATADGVVLVDENGTPSPPATVDGRFSSLRAGADGTHFVVTSTTAVTLLDTTGKVARVVDVKWLNDGLSTALDADVSPDGATLAVSTSGGRVVTIPLLSESNGQPTFWDQQVSAGSSTRVAYVPGTGKLVVSSADSALHRLEPGPQGLRTDGSVHLGDVAGSLTTGDDLVLATTDRGGTVLVDSATMQIVDRLPARLLDRYTPRLDPTTKTIRGLRVTSPTDGDLTTRAHAPYFHPLN